MAALDLHPAIVPPVYSGPVNLAAVTMIPGGLLEDENEDDGALQWNLRPAQDAVIPDGTAILVTASVKGPQPQDLTLIVVEPTCRYDPGKVMGLGMPRGVQRWSPGNPLQFIMVGVTTVELRLQRGVVVRTVYAVNNFDRKRMMQLVELVQEGAEVPRETTAERQR